MAYFPMFVNIEGKKVIVLGGGKNAYLKVNSLLRFGCKIAVIAPKVCDELKRTPGIAIHETNMSLDILKDADLVVAATTKAEVNAKIGRYCMDNGIQVNVSDNKDVSTFLFPGLVLRDELVIGVTTGGQSGAVAKEVRRMIDKLIPVVFGALTRKMGAYQSFVYAKTGDESRREQILDEILKMATNNDYEISEKKAMKIIEKYSR